MWILLWSTDSKKFLQQDPNIINHKEKIWCVYNYLKNKKIAVHVKVSVQLDIAHATQSLFFNNKYCEKISLCLKNLRLSSITYNFKKHSISL